MRASVTIPLCESVRIKGVYVRIRLASTFTVRLTPVMSINATYVRNVVTNASASIIIKIIIDWTCTRDAFALSIQVVPNETFTTIQWH